MGQTLDKPNLDKDTHFGENDYLSFAVSGMQGYRLTMEDAHNIFGNVDLSKFDQKVQKDTNISFFGIYDGHSGSEAAHYLSKHLLNKVMKHQQEANVQSPQELLSSDELIRKVRKKSFFTNL
jgi:protein phosphatase PTC2/3